MLAELTLIPAIFMPSLQWFSPFRPYDVSQPSDMIGIEMLSKIDADGRRETTPQKVLLRSKRGVSWKPETALVSPLLTKLNNNMTFQRLPLIFPNAGLVETLGCNIRMIVLHDVIIGELESGLKIIASDGLSNHAQLTLRQNVTQVFQHWAAHEPGNANLSCFAENS